MSSPNLEIPSYFSENAFAMARLAGTEIVYDLEKMDMFRDTAQNLVGRTIPEVGSLAMVYRFAPRGGDIECDPSFVRSKPGDALWVPADQLGRSNDESPTTVNRATVEQGNRKGFEVNLKDFTQPLIMSVVDSLCYPPPEDQVMIPQNGRMLKAWATQFIDTFTGPDRAKIDMLKEQATKHFAGAITIRAQTEKTDTT